MYIHLKTCISYIGRITNHGHKREKKWNKIKMK